MNKLVGNSLKNELLLTPGPASALVGMQGCPRVRGEVKGGPWGMAQKGFIYYDKRRKTVVFRTPFRV